MRSLARVLTLSALLVSTLMVSQARAQFPGRRGPEAGDRGGWGRPDRGGWGRPDRGGWGRPGRGGPWNPGPRPPQWPAPPPPPPQPAPGPQLLNVYRFFGGPGHLLSLDPNEGYRWGYQFEGLAFNTFAYPPQGVPSSRLFLCLVYDQETFVSTDPNCAGYQQIGNLGIVALQPSYLANRALVLCSLGRDHLATANVNECYNVRYPVQATLGYVP